VAVVVVVVVALDGVEVAVVVEEEEEVGFVMRVHQPRLSKQDKWHMKSNPSSCVNGP